MNTNTFNPIPFEHIESFIKIANSEIPGLKLCIYLTATDVDGDPIVRITAQPTAYSERLRVIRNFGVHRQFFIEVLKSHFESDESSQKDICFSILDIINRAFSTTDVNQITEFKEIIQNKKLLLPEQSEYDLLRDEYTKAISEFTENSVTNFPWVWMTPRSNNKERSISLESPSGY